jgi:fengycin family lipopeptide synthetase D
MLVLQDMETPEIRIPGLTLAPYRFESSRSKFDLTLTVIERQDKLDLLFEYCTLLFETETMLRFTRYFKKVVFSVIEEPGKPIAGLEIMDQEERRQILYDFNDTAADYPRDKTVHRLFEEQTARTPDAIAIHRSYRTYMTYKELNRKSNQLASLLSERGVASGDIVGVKVERSVEMMIGIYGILKAGGAYLPIDPGYPEERINYMLKDSGAKVLLTHLPKAPLHHSSFITHHSAFLTVRLPPLPFEKVC